jgi:hypothetical protein
MKRASFLAALVLGAALTLTLFIVPIASAAKHTDPPGGGGGLGGRYPPKSSYSNSPANCRKRSTCTPQDTSATLQKDNRAVTLGMVLGLGLAIVVTTPLLVSRKRVRRHH